MTGNPDTSLTIGDELRGASADMFRRIYWDTVLAASDPVLHMLREVAGISDKPISG